MSRPSRVLLFSLYIITICLGSSLTPENDKSKSSFRFKGSASNNGDSEIVNRANRDPSAKYFIKAFAKNRHFPGHEKTIEFHSSVQSKKYRPRHRQNRHKPKHIKHHIEEYATKPPKLKHNLRAVTPKTQPSSQRPNMVNHYSPVLNKEFSGTNFNPHQRKYVPHGILSSDSERPLQIIASSFQNLEPGDVVLSFHITIRNRGAIDLKVMTSHTCCFMMPKLGQAEEIKRKTVEHVHNCESMSLIGQREYTLRANETRNMTMLFASTQLLLYHYQRKGYCEIDFISDSKGAAIFASTKIDFDTALGRMQGQKNKKEQKKKEKGPDYLITANLEMKDGYYTGRLCEKGKCVPVDCVQEFGGGANRFSFYRGTCAPTPYCSPNGSLFFDYRWNKCKNVNDLRLDPVTDLDEVPQVVKESKPSLTMGVRRFLPMQDWRNLTHLNCDQLKQVAERTWGKNFLCENLPIICKKCSIK